MCSIILDVVEIFNIFNTFFFSNKFLLCAH